MNRASRSPRTPKSNICSRCMFRAVPLLPQRRYAARVVAARASEVAIFRKIAEGKLSPIDNQARGHRSNIVGERRS